MHWEPNEIPVRKAMLAKGNCLCCEADMKAGLLDPAKVREQRFAMPHELASIQQAVDRGVSAEANAYEARCAAAATHQQQQAVATQEAVADAQFNLEVAARREAADKVAYSNYLKQREAEKTFEGWRAHNRPK